MSSFSWSKLKKPFLCLAPLAGISDSPFRRICKKCWAELVFSEMVSTEGLNTKSPKTLGLLGFTQSERPLIFQLFGKNPQSFAQAVQLIHKLHPQKRPNGIDLNLGCPARKVRTHGSGVALMRKPKLVSQIIQAVVDNTDLPLSVKIRAGISREKVSALSFIQKTAWQKLAAISIHGRTAEQGFSGPINYDQIKKIKKFTKKTVIANGGIADPQSARIMLKKTGADGLMIGQASFGNPWIFQMIKKELNGQRAKAPTLKQKAKIALYQAKLMVKEKEKIKGVREMRKHLLWYFRGFPGARNLRKKLARVENLADIQICLARLEDVELQDKV